MPGCVLHVSGERFEVDQFLVSLSFKPYRVHHRGEPTVRRTRGERHDDSGFSVDVSEVFIVLLMAGCPGLYDSKRRFSSNRHFYAAQRQHQSAPSGETQRELAAAGQKVEEAKRQDKRDIMFFEVFMLGILGVLIYAFIRAGKSVQKISAA